MIKIPKDEILKILELNPVFFIGKEILLKNKDNSVKIVDVNLKCSYFNVEHVSGSTEWINVNTLDDEITFNSFNLSDKNITIKTLMNIIKKE